MRLLAMKTTPSFNSLVSVRGSSQHLFDFDLPGVPPGSETNHGRDADQGRHHPFLRHALPVEIINENNAEQGAVITSPATQTARKVKRFCACPARKVLAPPSFTKATWPPPPIKLLNPHGGISLLNVIRELGRRNTANSNTPSARVQKLSDGELSRCE